MRIRWHLSLVVVLLMATSITFMAGKAAQDAPSVDSQTDLPSDVGAITTLSNHIYMPIVMAPPLRSSRFGFQLDPTRRLEIPRVKSNADQLGAKWVRAGMLSWRLVQPTQNGGYNWAAMDQFEQHIRGLRDTGLDPMIIVGDSPDWATLDPPDVPWKTSCGPIK